jgi:hypothetical protein
MIQMWRNDVKPIIAYISYVRRYTTSTIKWCGQIIKSVWWMSRCQEAKKDVVGCDMPGLGVKQPLYPGISEWGNPI